MRYVYLKLEKQGLILGKLPLMKCPEGGTKSLISEFLKLVFKLFLCNMFIIEGKFQATNVEIVKT